MSPEKENKKVHTININNNNKKNFPSSNHNINYKIKTGKCYCQNGLLVLNTSAVRYFLCAFTVGDR